MLQLNDNETPVAPAKEAMKDNRQGRGRSFCYLLRSLNPANPMSTYVGFTVNPKRRIRQHNGEIKAGARRVMHLKLRLLQRLDFPSVALFPWKQDTTEPLNCPILSAAV